jgi:NDP-4-keto-2,6-dideoxyhexose 3-C-methyltransferase
VPIIPEAEWREDPAPFVLIGAWQFRDAFVAREAAYLAKGGSFVFPLPHVEVIHHGT